VEDGRVGLGAGVWLHVGVIAAKERERAVDGELFGDVDVLAAAVVTAARVALRVLVGQHRALTFQDRARREVLRGDHLERLLLARELGAQDRSDRWVEDLQLGVEDVVDGGLYGLCHGSARPFQEWVSSARRGCNERSDGAAPRYSAAASISHSARYSANEARTNTQ